MRFSSLGRKVSRLLVRRVSGDHLLIKEFRNSLVPCPQRPPQKTTAKASFCAPRAFDHPRGELDDLFLLDQPTNHRIADPEY
jgi:hypothetical protein